jgi:hypothetical protein
MATTVADSIIGFRRFGQTRARVKLTFNPKIRREFRKVIDQLVQHHSQGDKSRRLP